jgi:hypothetical protein
MMQSQLLLAALDKDHSSTIYDLLLATLHSQDPSHNCHCGSILTRFLDLFDLLSEQSNKDFMTSVVKAATTAYQEEIQNLILKQSGLHFDCSHTGLSQLEGFSIAELGWKIQHLVPHLVFGWMSAQCGARSSSYCKCKGNLTVLRRILYLDLAKGNPK